jgi:hypothetical protein
VATGAQSEPSRLRTVGARRALLLAGNVVVGLMVAATVVAAFVPPHGLIFAWAVVLGVAALVELLVCGALLSLRDAWPAVRRTRGSRIGFRVVAVLALSSAPLAFALLQVADATVWRILAAGLLGLALGLRPVAAVLDSRARQLRPRAAHVG